MRTAFGKFCMGLRMERNELLFHMAKKLNVKSSFLSSVENGKKSVPKSWAKLITDIYELNDFQIKQLNKSIDDSVQSIKIDLYDKSMIDRKLALDFARSFDNMDFTKKEALRRLLM